MESEKIASDRREFQRSFQASHRLTESKESPDELRNRDRAHMANLISKDLKKDELLV